jgi:hypothetical protein
MLVSSSASLVLFVSVPIASWAPGGPGESHPGAPTERSVTVSRHSARLI